MSPLISSFILESSCPCSQSISLPDVSLSSLLLLRATLEMGGVSRWLDSLSAAESLLAVLTTLGGHCSLQMDHRMVVAPLYFFLGARWEDMVDLVDPVRNDFKKNAPFF